MSGLTTYLIQLYVFSKMGRNAVAKYVCSLLVPFFATRNEKELTDPKSTSIMTMHVYLHQDSATTLLSRPANRLIC